MSATTLAGRPAAALRAARPAHRHWLVAVFAVGLIARLALIPITHGQDFVVWDKASAAALAGVNLYAHHPHYPGGPFAYFPLWVYLEVPFQWLHQVTGVPFQILGKLPILAGDVGTAMLIARELRDHGRDPAFGTALFFLNPLVVYNSAFYGRFDSVACALALLAVRLVSKGSRASGVAFGLAVAAKTYPVFLLAGLLRAARGARARLVVLATAVVAVLSLPYIAALHAMVHDIVLYDTHKQPQGLSWLQLTAHPRWVTDGLLLAFVAATLALAAVRDLYRYCAAVLLLFLVCSKVVIEQYLTWPLAFLALVAVLAERRTKGAALALVALLTAVGMLANPYVHPWGTTPTALLIILAAGCAAGVVALAVSPTPRRRSPRSAPALPSRRRA